MAGTVSVKAVVIIRTLLYAAITITSFIIFVPVAISMGKFSGDCLLYSTKVTGIHITFGSESNCVYIIATSVVFNLVFGLVLTGSGVVTLIGRPNPLSDLTSLPFLLNVFLDGLSCAFIFISGCILSVGLKETCDAITSGSCSSAAVKVSGGSTYFFYGHLSTAQVAVWVSFILWLAQLGVALFTLWRLGKLCCGRYTTSSETPTQQTPTNQF
ncbi:transmembrane protein 179B-like [Gigantopelta aegis]|uniref:transmembrane protein 179B-like n=1 Tax=Gigantopelta aegis TaxID=1735272 RepID=UPI001B88B68B|nr:transmembrane protein 179B-like [Gigantopelta aegis]